MKLNFKFRVESSGDWHWMIDSKKGLVAAGHESKYKDAIDSIIHYTEKFLRSEFKHLEDNDD